MSEPPDTVAVQVCITWLETKLALENFLTDELPPELRERELVDLQNLIDKVVRRLREKKRA